MSFLRCSLLIALLAPLAGCQPDPPIKIYEVLKDTPDRMLGAIVLQEKAGWFFKLTGPKKDIDEKSKDFKAFIESIRFEPDRAVPHWELPEGWEVTGGPEKMRLATITVPMKSKDGELSITLLGRSEGSDNEYLLANINRWREQMGQSKIGEADLSSLQRVKSAGSEAYLISIPGKQKAGGMTPPFAGGQG